MKIIELIRQRETEGRPWFSLEFYPYKTTEGVYSLFDRIERLTHLQPLFADVTWGAGGSTAQMSFEITAALQNYMCVETQMHLTCTNMEKEKFVDALRQCYENNVQNILALRGDPPRGQDSWTPVEGGFEHASDLVRFIRKEYGDYFGVTVAGYPEGHLDCENYETDLQHLKEKVDAGADLVITQLFYDVDIFIKFVQDCRAIGIKCPIIPGIMPITSEADLRKIIKFSPNTKVPEYVWSTMERLKGDEEAIAKFGLEFVTQMCRKILSSGVSGLHIYTMNQEKPVKDLLAALGLLCEQATLPWRPTVIKKRREEDVRPIFWANRPKSYLVRTKEWKDFPSGRWGDNRAPDFGEPGNWHGLPELNDIKNKYKQLWGEKLEREQDVFHVFCNFVEGKINLLPWNEVPMREESRLISNDLLRLNKMGFLTINSQPMLNGIESENPQYGWGGKGGRVYQKAYVECFAAPELLDKLLKAAEKYPTLTIHAINRKGDIKCNKLPAVNAVTWGIFPDTEVLQPTVVDPESLKAWKDEAFTLWSSLWASIYPVESRSHHLLIDMIDTYYLVTIVDNNYIDGDVFAVFDDLAWEIALATRQ